MSMPIRKRAGRKPAGFTLIELLIAFAVVSLVMALGVAGVDFAWVGAGGGGGRGCAALNAAAVVPVTSSSVP